MNAMPAALTIETAHVWAAVMGGEKACLQLLAAKLHEAVVAAGAAAQAPMRAAPKAIGDDGGTGQPPALSDTTSFAASSEAEKINTPAAAPPPDGPTVTIKGAEVPIERFLALWYEADSIAAIGEALGCSGQTVVNVSKRLDLPGRFSATWTAVGAAWRKDAGAGARPDQSLAEGGDAAAPATAAPAEAPPPPHQAPSAPDGKPWPARPAPRVRCAFVTAADRTGATTCRAERVPGEVYCAIHLAQVRADRGRP